MSQENNTNPTVEKTTTPKQSHLTFNLLNIEPEAVVYPPIYIKDLKEHITNIVREKYFSDVQAITIMTDKDTGEVQTFVWLPKNSSHFVDQDSNSNKNSIVDINIRRHSEKLKEFMKIFCSEKNRTIYSSEDRYLLGVKVEIERFLEIFFDQRGFEFKRINGTQNPPISNLEIEKRFIENSGKKDYNQLLALVVRKIAPRKSGFKRDPKPIFKA